MGTNHPTHRLALDGLEAARMFTDLTGGVHEAQALQLRKWPLIAIDGSATSQAHVDVGPARSEQDADGNLFRKHRKVSVSYMITLVEGADRSKMGDAWDFGCKALAIWTRELFWPDTNVQVFVEDELIFETPNE